MPGCGRVRVWSWSVRLRLRGGRRKPPAPPPHTAHTPVAASRTCTVCVPAQGGLGFPCRVVQSQVKPACRVYVQQFTAHAQCVHPADEGRLRLALHHGVKSVLSGRSLWTREHSVPSQWPPSRAVMCMAKRLLRFSLLELARPAGPLCQYACRSQALEKPKSFDSAYRSMKRMKRSHSSEPRMTTTPLTIRGFPLTKVAVTWMGIGGSGGLVCEGSGGGLGRR